MKKCLLLSVIVLLQFSLLLHSQEVQWLGKRVSNTAFYLDPTEIQTFGSITVLSDQKVSEHQYLPFSFGGNTSIYSKQVNEVKSWEVIAELGTFTQFEWKLVEGEQQRNLINTDYKVAVSYARKVNKKLTYRLRFFHVSSHLGDDYLIRNQIRSYSPNKVNYEQLELTYFYQYIPSFKLIIGLGSVIRPQAERLPFSYHLGSIWNRKSDQVNWGLSGGLSIKGFQEMEFTPSLKACFGPAYFNSKKTEPLRVQFEYYTGYLPYSQFEKQRLSWLGIGMYFYL